MSYDPVVDHHSSSSSLQGGYSGSAVRQSILSRPLRSGFNRSNSENLDVEYEKEQRRLDAKRQKYNELMENRRKSLWGTQEDKIELQEKRRTEIEDHLQRRHDDARVKAIEEVQTDYVQAHTVHQFDQVEKSQAEQKRQYLRSLMEDNKRLAEYRSMMKMQERQQDMHENDPTKDFFDRHRSYT